ncbi:hypothetical protein TRFO_32403 [Tritrichomonas foetus]|uniref:Uncharacterized protein n=1 Tax=Tritrichomonas foetus TaxID=1144522 RepID=A0A1J4JNY4_9EUKA|nr:hypothetical protein TRFO_32403 [Tritrichomonas foetus]|eukprot:OHT00841.1 hypothetical protein TRFO_32403 [Tritrichomonas foetus]
MCAIRLPIINQRCSRGSIINTMPTSKSNVLIKPRRKSIRRNSLLMKIPNVFYTDIAQSFKMAFATLGAPIYIGKKNLNSQNDSFLNNVPLDYNSLQNYSNRSPSPNNDLVPSHNSNQQTNNMNNFDNNNECSILSREFTENEKNGSAENRKQMPLSQLVRIVKQDTRLLEGFETSFEDIISRALFQDAHFYDPDIGFEIEVRRMNWDEVEYMYSLVTIIVESQLFSNFDDKNRFISNLIKLLNSPDFKERLTVEILVRRIFDLYPNSRNFAIHELMKLVESCEKEYCIDHALKLINGYVFISQHQAKSILLRLFRRKYLNKFSESLKLTLFSLYHEEFNQIKYQNSLCNPDSNKINSSGNSDMNLNMNNNNGKMKISSINSFSYFGKFGNHLINNLIVSFGTRCCDKRMRFSACENYYEITLTYLYNMYPVTDQNRLAIFISFIISSLLTFGEYLQDKLIEETSQKIWDALTNESAIVVDAVLDVFNNVNSYTILCKIGILKNLPMIEKELINIANNMSWSENVAKKAAAALSIVRSHKIHERKVIQVNKKRKTNGCNWELIKELAQH